jgi:hypothetical protein
VRARKSHAAFECAGCRTGTLSVRDFDFAGRPRYSDLLTVASSFKSMAAILDKLNLRDHAEILVLNAPDSFEKEIRALRSVRVCRRIEEVKSLSFALAFVDKRAELAKLSRTLAARAVGDALLWFAYPKGTSRKYTCDFNRDDGWDALRQSGFDSVRQVTIDEDWSALRFRRVEFINKARTAARRR